MTKSMTTSVLVLLPAIVAACGADNAAAPATGRCSQASPASVSLLPGAYTTISATADSGCVTFAENASADTAEYLVLAQSASGIPGSSAAFELKSANLYPVTAPTTRITAGAVSAARAFDRAMRVLGARRAYPALQGVASATPRAPSVALGPPVAGSSRSFKVCAQKECTTLNTVTATAQAVGVHIAVYVDNAAPANGLNAADLDSLKTLFDTRLYGLDTVAFGREPDLDSNGVVIVLMTNAVNSLAPSSTCTTDGFVAGFFYPGDLDPAFSTQFNHGEIFYTIVADSAGTLSCAHSRDEVKALTPTTFLHEFQHMINFTQHVVVRGAAAEDDWVDEGLSKLAEELGGRSFLPGDLASFSRYAIDDVFEAYQYLSAPEAHFLVTTSDEDQPDVGAGWLFMRYLYDQLGSGITRTLVLTSRTGAANVAAATGQPFPTLVERWGLANLVSDLSGFTAPAELQYTAWHFHSTFGSLHTQDAADFPAAFPLVPARSRGDSLATGGTLHAGSATYRSVVQPPHAPAFTLQLTSNGTALLATGTAAQLTVLRLR